MTSTPRPDSYRVPALPRTGPLKNERARQGTRQSPCSQTSTIRAVNFNNQQSRTSAATLLVACQRLADGLFRWSTFGKRRFPKVQFPKLHRRGEPAGTSTATPRDEGPRRARPGGAGAPARASGVLGSMMLLLSVKTTATTSESSPPGPTAPGSGGAHRAGHLVEPTGAHLISPGRAFGEWRRGCRGRRPPQTHVDEGFVPLVLPNVDGSCRSWSRRGYVAPASAASATSSAVVVGKQSGPASRVVELDESHRGEPTGTDASPRVSNRAWTARTRRDRQSVIIIAG